MHVIYTHDTVSLYIVPGCEKCSVSYAGLHDTHSDLRCLFNRKELGMQEGSETC